MPILCAASQEGLQRIVERILDRGADPNAKEKVTSVHCKEVGNSEAIEANV